MSRYFVTLHTVSDRIAVARIIDAAPVGTRVEIKSAKRSLPQNELMWAMLTEIAQQLPWHGSKLRPDDYKILFLDALHRELQMVPNIDDTGFVNIRSSSSDLSKSEMSDMIELMYEFGSRHGVKFSDRNP